ncbi:hypothetical protein EXIGLDRAFT_320587 [Exidia glandulosa HHB12029]|uniref:F-box domain-containing protein n=1 Tax=Exidia glandulosa HHB12029 TaxID=1314781 RepID=A0A165Q5I2_EXIGL|nr:hypothetical protein EXIGLDRAFT_320587 [Exidia glandulosa HHB12029]
MAGASIEDLPDELLCDIFVYLTFAGRVTSTHVCRRWRAASLDAPGQLWNEVVSSARRLGVLEQVLVRSGTAPVSLTILIMDANAAEVTTALVQHLEHCKALRLQIIDAIEDKAAIDIAQAMSTAAPILERFALLDRRDCVVRGFAGDLSSLFAAQAPRLVLFKHKGGPGHFRDVPALRSVRHFVHKRALLAEENVIAAADISPNLLDVGFHFRVCAFDPSSPVAITFPRNIQSVTLVVDKARPAACLAALNLSGLRRVTITYRIPYLAEDKSHEMMLLVMEKLALVPRRMYVDIAPNGSAMFELGGRDGQFAEFNYIHLSLPPPILLHLTVLEIVEASWNAIPLWPPAPALRELTIMLVAPESYDPNVDIGMFVDVRRDLVLQCPALHTLSISTRQRGDPALKGFFMSIPSESLLLFVQEQLRTGKERIPLLRLCGLQLAVHHIDVLASLLDLFDDVQLAPGHAGVESTPIEQALDM